MTPRKTATGGFPIGYRRIASDWQKADNTAVIAEWTAQNGFGFLDIGCKGAPADAAILAKAGLGVGTSDLFDWGGYQSIIAPDSDARRKAVEETSAHIEANAAAGIKRFFAVTPPMDDTKSRRENYDLMVEGYGALLPALQKTGSKVAIEGWPGMGAVCCTPEVYRAFFKAVGSDCFGVNYDSSHLIRMGVDPLRFLREFARQVVHVHGKDTSMDPEAQYEHGWELMPTFAKQHGFGAAVWRYTIPGHGTTNWIETFRILKDAGYQGGVSIELEDENFNGSTEGEKRGLIKGREFLEGC